MKIIQPPPRSWSDLQRKSNKFLETSFPLFNIQSRYAHHADFSGYDQLSRYLGTPLDLRPVWYWLGETALRPFCLAQARFTKHYEYSRYDCAFELDVMSRMICQPRAIFHFLYSEKSYRLSRHTKRDHVFVGSVHHPVSHHRWMFESMKHFAAMDLIFVLSRDSVEPWQKIVGHENVYFIPHGVDCEHFSPTNENPDNTIVFCGQHERDHETLSAVADALLPRFKDWRLLMLSKHPTCQKIAERHQNAEVLFYLEDKQYLAIMRKAAVMLLPLKASTACNSTLEAMACGAPVVTSSIGMESYIDATCGHVCRVGDVDAFIQSLEKLINSPAHLAAVRKCARAKAETFHWVNVAQQMESYLQAAWCRQLR